MKKYLFFITLFVYLFFAGKFQYQFSVTKTNYFILLSDAFLNGQSHLRLIPQYLRDLSLYNGKYYLYWPPLPAVLYLPIVALFGTNISDIFLLSITASVVPLLLFLSLEELKKSKIVILERKQILLLSLFLAFGTCFFSISILGTVWFASQVVTLLVFALALLFAIRFFNYDNKIDFILGSIFFALLVWTRFTVLFSSPLFLYIYSYKRKKMVLPFLSFLFFSVLILGLYNQTRFGSFFETGLRFHNMNSRYLKNFQAFGAVSLRYFPHNFFYTVVNPIILKPAFPFFNPNPEGNSIFLTSPLFILLFTPLFRNLKMKKQSKRFFTITLFSFVLIIVVVLMYLGSGWFQFGSRYLLDGVLLAIVLLAFILPYVSKKLTLLLFYLSVAINTLGAFWLLYLRSYPLFYDIFH